MCTTWGAHPRQGSTRHFERDGPLDPSSYVAVFGQLVHWPTIPTLGLAPLIVLAYVHFANREEECLIKRFGLAYVDYQARVSMFMPRWRDVRRHLAAS